MDDSDLLARTLPTRLWNPQVASSAIAAALLSGAITDPADAKHVRRLVIKDIKLTSLIGIGAFEHLDELELRCPVSTLEGIDAAANLQHLTIWTMNARSLAPLQHLHELRSLRLQGGKRLDFTPLAKLAHLRHLECAYSSILTLKPLAKLAALRILDVANCKLASLAGIERLDLSLLDASSTQIADLAPLARTRSLRALNISSTRVRDLAPLARLDGLRRLDLSVVKVKNLAPLAQLTSLADLNISRVPVKDGSPIASLPLSTLDAWDTQLDPAFITQLRAAAEERAARASAPSLMVLILSHGLAIDAADARDVSHITTRVEDLSDLRDLDALPNLRVLELGHGKIASVRGGKKSGLRALQFKLPAEKQLTLDLRHLSDLDTLGLIAAETVTITDLELPRSLRSLEIHRAVPPINFASKLPELRYLGVFESKLAAVPSLDKSPHLVRLELERCDIGDISALADHPALRRVSLSQNRVTDVGALARVRNLRRLDLDANPVADFRALAKLEHLEWLSVRMTPGERTASQLRGVTVET